MAQTRRKTKHRGNAAGMVESRGRTGRRPTADEKKGPVKSGERRSDKDVPRADRPPSWRSALYRSLAATGFLIVVSVLLLHTGAKITLLVPVVIVVYTLFGYYTDRYLYQRRQRRKAEGKIKA